MKGRAFRSFCISWELLTSVSIRIDLWFTSSFSRVRSLTFHTPRSLSTTHLIQRKQLRNIPQGCWQDCRLYFVIPPGPQSHFWNIRFFRRSPFWHGEARCWLSQLDCVGDAAESTVTSISSLLLSPRFLFQILFISFRNDGSKTNGSTAIWCRNDGNLIRDVPSTTAADWWNEQPAVSVPGSRESTRREH